MSEGTQFYYNLTTGSVEEGRQSPGTELMGPYATRAEAERALETAATRNEQWDADDAAWDGEESPPAEADDPR
ncbi:SPOR domain-containing protein [Brachybacterium sp. YJGR34]|uniref:SPOR domain-containing protein n=1 Tax=Brachybacterium sp. YJGR34 TaxID=2059911 RepID=UPI000E0B931B|nr:SPOR domain-containing protein [Brachybacterium sp. YJGR34]